jgi:hypothetical protein
MDPEPAWIRIQGQEKEEKKRKNLHFLITKFRIYIKEKNFSFTANGPVLIIFNFSLFNNAILQTLGSELQ